MVIANGGFFAIGASCCAAKVLNFATFTPVATIASSGTTTQNLIIPVPVATALTAITLSSSHDSLFGPGIILTGRTSANYFSLTLLRR